MKIAAIIQARTGSTRLPNKVLQDLAGQPMLTRVVNRVRRAKIIDEVLVATTVEPADDAIAQLCEKQGWPYYRGSQEDVLDRYYQAACNIKADVIVRITSDCPLIEPDIISRVAQEILDHRQELDYVSNITERTFPQGLDVEAVSFDALTRAWEEDDNPAWREHVTLYIYRHPEKFRLRNIKNPKDYSHLRWTVDTADDLELIRKIYDHFRDTPFDWHDVLKLLDKNPGWPDINRHIEQKVVP